LARKETAVAPFPFPLLHFSPSPSPICACHDVDCERLYIKQNILIKFVSLHTCRFGWYIPTELEEQLWNDSRIIADNWRALKLQTVLGHLLHNTSTLTSQVNTSNHKESCENVVGCRNGWYYGPKCQDGDNTLHCAVLLADFPGLSLVYFRWNCPLCYIFCLSSSARMEIYY